MNWVNVSSTVRFVGAECGSNQIMGGELGNDVQGSENLSGESEKNNKPFRHNQFPNQDSNACSLVDGY
jgi:hypothetical protein